MTPEVRAQLEAWLESDDPIVRQHARRRLDDAPPAAYPPVATQIGNAIRAAAAFVADGFRTVDQAEQTRRLDICRACEHHDAAQGRCRKCGCNSNLKARIASSSCPIGLW